tara:strand:- start:20 stop:334 length:315 start_codon:yes stop_codon:yes gene_type:complete
METTSQEQQQEKYTEFELKQMRDTIDKMNVSNHIEILRILIKNNSDLNENQYGVHVNMSELSMETLDNIHTYIKYVKSQNEEFNVVENIKNKYRNDFFSQPSSD